MPKIPAPRLEEICRGVIQAMGTGESATNEMVESLIAANVEGMDSHGIIRLMQYADLMDKGRINPKAEPELVRQDRAVSLLDGHWCFGQVGARVAARLAVKSAREHGLGAAGIYHVSHVGRLKDYVHMVGRENMIGLAFCNSGPAKGGIVAPYRGAKCRFGTNPLAFAVPRRSGDVMIGDFATSVSSEGKVRVARNSGKKVPDGTIIDKDGRPTNDPNDFYAGGALLPMAAHKGYCLSLFVDIIGGLLVGAGNAALAESDPGNGFFIIAIDAAAFKPVDTLQAELEELLAAVKSTPSIAGQPPVLLPGEPEDIAREERLRTGIPVDDTTWGQIKALGDRFRLPAALFEI